MTKRQYHSTAPAPADGASIEPQCDSRGNTKVAIFDGTAQGAVVSINGDGASTSGFGLSVRSKGDLYNGTSWDRARNNTDLTLLASAARTATLQSSDQTNYNGRGLHVVLDVTSAGTGSITLTIYNKDVLSGKYYAVLAGVAVTTNSTNVYKIYPGFPATANVSANDLLSRIWRIEVVHNNANSITYSVGASVIL